MVVRSIVSLRKPPTMDGSSSSISRAFESSWCSDGDDVFPYRWKTSHEHKVWHGPEGDRILVLGHSSIKCL